MKLMLISATILALTTGASLAAPRPAGAPRLQELYTCAGSALSRVALRPTPHPCCTGLLGCPQLLATTELVRPKRGGRT